MPKTPLDAQLGPAYMAGDVMKVSGADEPESSTSRAGTSRSLATLDVARPTALGPLCPRAVRWQLPASLLHLSAGRAVRVLTSSLRRRRVLPVSPTLRTRPFGPGARSPTEDRAISSGRSLHHLIVRHRVATRTARPRSMVHSTPMPTGNSMGRPLRTRPDASPDRSG